MELKTSNSLDLSINKDDLIDMMVDKELTTMEELIKAKRAERDDITKKIQNLYDAMKAPVDKRIMKMIPAGLDQKDVVGLNYSQNYSSTYVEVKFKDFSLRFDDVNTVIPITADYNKKKQQAKDLKATSDKLYHEINELQQECLKLEKSPKRLKAKLLSNFLKNSKEGQEVLKLLSTESLKMLPNKTN